jgi:hypothetical protein
MKGCPLQTQTKQNTNRCGEGLRFKKHNASAVAQSLVRYIAIRRGTRETIEKTIPRFSHRVLTDAIGVITPVYHARRFTTE